ncbi:MAG: DUF447 domain-containing protein [Promethearchaeota archaeon]
MLPKLGFINGEVVEVLLTTISAKGEPNTAPMGVWIEKGPRLALKPYQETQSARNMEITGEAVLNLSQNPELFLSFAFKEELRQLQSVEYVSAKTVKPPRLFGANAFVEVTVKPKHSPESAVPFKEFLCTVQHVEITSKFPMVFSRSRSAAIECVIYATKIRALHKTDPITVKHLAHQIGEYYAFVERIAPQSPAAEVIRKVEALLPKWIK